MNLKIKLVGKSMYPLISSGDTVVVDTNYTFQKCTIGDVVVFNNNHNYVAHRIIKKLSKNNQLEFLTKGDFNTEIDPRSLIESMYIGKVIAVENSFHSISLTNKNILQKLMVYYSILNRSIFVKNIFSKLFHNLSFYDLFILLFANQKKFFIFKTKLKKKYKKYDAEYLHYLLLLQYSNQLLIKCDWDFVNKPVSKKNFSFFGFNKVNTISEHFLFCKNCSKYFPKEYKSFAKSIVSNEFVSIFLKQKLIKKLKKMHISQEADMTLLKDFIFPTKITEGQKEILSKTFHTAGSDLDIIVQPKLFKKFIKELLFKGYKKDLFAFHEVLLKHESFPIDIDIHYLSHFSRTLIFDKRLTKILSKQILREGKKNNSYPSIELLFFSTIVRFWTNDLHRGLKKTYEIALLTQFLSFHGWKKVYKLAKSYNFYYELLLTIYVSSLMFPFTYFPKKEFRISFFEMLKIKFVARYFSLEKITDFSGIKDWWDEGNLQTRKHLLDLHFTRIFLNKPWFIICLKPRVIAFLILFLTKR